uniref:Lysosomal enzyme trafficking factor n=1 Tax=Scylla olivacea TaxID=85551 RepID=A0A0P4W5L4_SCYOL
MNFRQRIAWLCLALYLASSFAAVYYFLDIADQFAEFSMEHSKLHQASDSSDVSMWRFWHHIGDVPFHILVLIFAIPYLQVFAALFYCTLPTIDKNVNKCLIPVIGWMYMFQKFFSLFKNHRDLDMKRDNPHTVSIS